MRGSANKGPYHELSGKAKVQEVDHTTVVRYAHGTLQLDCREGDYFGVHQKEQE